jgi:PAS domain-containing protein
MVENRKKVEQVARLAGIDTMGHAGSVLNSRASASVLPASGLLQLKLLVSWLVPLTREAFDIYLGIYKNLTFDLWLRRSSADIQTAMGKVFSLPHQCRLPWTAQSILELSPGAIAVWSADRSNCILNHAARQMTGFTERDFRENRTLWIGRVHPDDQQSFLRFWSELERTEKKLICDYRFLQNGRKKEIRLRDNSGSLKNADGQIEIIISSYMDISDLTGDKDARAKEGAEQSADLIRPLLHEIQNSVHVMRMGIELMSMDKTNAFGLQGLLRGIESLDKLSKDLSEYCFPTQAQLSAAQAEMPFKEVMSCVQTELQRHGLNARLLDRSGLPVIQIDLLHFLRALKHLVKFCQVLLPPCAELKVEAGQSSIGGQAYLAFKLDNAVAASIDLDEKEAFHPFLRINGVYLGLGMAIARQILRCLGGDLLFQKETTHRYLLTLLLKARPG